MTLTTSNTKTFTLTVDDLITEAFGEIGADDISGHEASSARLQLNLLLIELSNRSVPLHVIEDKEVDLVTGTKTYSLGDVIDVIGESGLIVYDGKEYVLDRLPLLEFNRINNKDQLGRPSCFVVDRDSTAVSATLWPIPDANYDYSFKCKVAEHMDTITASHQLIEVPRRFYPVLLAGLAYKLSRKRVGIPQNLRMELGQEYLRLLEDLENEDGERADMNVIPPNYKRR